MSLGTTDRRWWRALAGAILLACAVAGEARADSGALADLNERWAGARCRIRFDVPFKKRPDGRGWARSIAIVPRNQYDKKLAGAYFKISNRDLLSGKFLPRGTAFVAEGWEFEKAEKESGLVLRLRLADGSGEAEMSFVGSWGVGLGAKRADTVERWARIELFQVKAADEVLVDAPPAVGTTPPAAGYRPPPVGTASPPAPAMVEPGAVAVRVVGVAVEPLRVVPGGEINLVVTYAVDGLAAGQTIEVLEKRSILRVDERLATLEASAIRGAGTHRSSQSLSVPTSLDAGILVFEASVRVGESETRAETLFQVAEGGN